MFFLFTIICFIQYTWICIYDNSGSLFNWLQADMNPQNQILTYSIIILCIVCWLITNNVHGCNTTMNYAMHVLNFLLALRKILIWFPNSFRRSLKLRGKLFLRNHDWANSMFPTFSMACFLCFVLFFLW